MINITTQNVENWLLSRINILNLMPQGEAEFLNLTRLVGIKNPAYYSPFDKILKAKFGHYGPTCYLRVTATTKEADLIGLVILTSTGGPMEEVSFVDNEFKPMELETCKVGSSRIDGQADKEQFASSVLVLVSPKALEQITDSKFILKDKFVQNSKNVLKAIQDDLQGENKFLKHAIIKNGNSVTILLIHFENEDPYAMVKQFVSLPEQPVSADSRKEQQLK